MPGHLGVANQWNDLAGAIKIIQSLRTVVKNNRSDGVQSLQCDLEKFEFILLQIKHDNSPDVLSGEVKLAVDKCPEICSLLQDDLTRWDNWTFSTPCSKGYTWREILQV